MTRPEPGASLVRLAHLIRHALDRSPRGLHVSRCEAVAWLEMLNVHIEDQGERA